MGKIIAWLVVIFIVLLALRLVNQRKARKQQRAAGSTAVEPMVRCTRCGVFLPRADAIQCAGEYACPDGQCVKR
jgi:ribosomal protein S26